MCHCRQGVESQFCTSAISGTFYPAVDYLLFEAESSVGNYATLTPANGYGSVYTGRGYAQLSSGQYVHFNSLNVQSKLSVLCSREIHLPWPVHSQHLRIRNLKIQGPTLVKNCTVHLVDLEMGSGQALTFPGLLPLLKGIDYNFTITYISSSSSDCKVQVDSIVLIPYVNGTRVFTMSSMVIQSTLQGCVNF